MIEKGKVSAENSKLDLRFHEGYIFNFRDALPNDDLCCKCYNIYVRILAVRSEYV